MTSQLCCSSFSSFFALPERSTDAHFQTNLISNQKKHFPKKFCSKNLKLYFREDSFESKLGGGLNKVFRVRGFSEMIWNEANSDLTSWRTKKFFFKLELDSEKLQKNPLFVPIWSLEFCFCKKQPIKFLTIWIFSQLFIS